MDKKLIIMEPQLVKQIPSTVVQLKIHKKQEISVMFIMDKKLIIMDLYMIKKIFSINIELNDLFYFLIFIVKFFQKFYLL